MINLSLLLAVPAFMALTSCQSGQTTNPTASLGLAPYKGSAAFERLKTLEGKWVGDSFKLEGVSWENGKPSPCGPPVIFRRQ